MTSTSKPEGASPGKPAKESNDYAQYRYWTRIAKGSALPLLYTLISVLMLRNYVLEFPMYNEYKVPFIAMGVGLGLFTMTGLTLVNVFRAKGSKTGIKLDSWTMIAVFVVVFLIVGVLVMFLGIATVWQFSIGFFATTLIPPILVLLLEVAFRGRFSVREYVKASETKRLVLVPNPSG